MAPEYGATCGFFPVDAETLRYLRFSGRCDEQVALVEAYCTRAGAVPHRRVAGRRSTPTRWSWTWRTVEPSVAGPKRPQDRVALFATKKSFEQALPSLVKPKKKAVAPLR